MYARLVILQARPTRAVDDPGAGRSVRSSLRAQPGFNELYVLGNQVSGEYGSFSVWESKDDAEAADAMIAPQLQQALAGRLQGAPTRWFFDVVEPT